jgi:hypothetical protein
VLCANERGDVFNRRLRSVIAGFVGVVAGGVAGGGVEIFGRIPGKHGLVIFNVLFVEGFIV